MPQTPPISQIKPWIATEQCGKTWGGEYPRPWGNYARLRGNCGGIDIEVQASLQLLKEFTFREKNQILREVVHCENLSFVFHFFWKFWPTNGHFRNQQVARGHKKHAFVFLKHPDAQKYIKTNCVNHVFSKCRCQRDSNH